MTKYYIFRHGQTKFSKYHLPYPKDNRLIKILPDSVPALKKMAKYLKNISSDLNISSEYLRCQQTTKIITQISKSKFEKDARLNEFGGETYLEFIKRIKSFLKEIKNSNYQNVIICTHGAVIAVLKNLLTKNRIKRKEILTFPNPGVLMIVKGKKIQEIDFN